MHLLHTIFDAIIRRHLMRSGGGLFHFDYFIMPGDAIYATYDYAGAHYLFRHFAFAACLPRGCCDEEAGAYFRPATTSKRY